MLFYAKHTAITHRKILLAPQATEVYINTSKRVSVDALSLLFLMGGWNGT
jgi:hypothetical protein